MKDLYPDLDLDKPIEWPAMVVCRMPRDRDESKYGEFIGKGVTESFKSYEEFDRLKNETFYSNVKDIVYAVTIADSYLKGFLEAIYGVASRIIIDFFWVLNSLEN